LICAPGRSALIGWSAWATLSASRNPSTKKTCAFSHPNGNGCFHRQTVIVAGRHNPARNAGMLRSLRRGPLRPPGAGSIGPDLLARTRMNSRIYLCKRMKLARAVDSQIAIARPPVAFGRRSGDPHWLTKSALLAARADALTVEAVEIQREHHDAGGPFREERQRQEMPPRDG